ncbi:TonB-dependent receptor [Novosphingobium rosa]|uniref:TonB-dependent receptor n=1 Tax=Novosphingobium rosa TaxID=76978 RepID=UPI000A5B43B9|nr:TonB-dependent receptor [Novosphingobium rosa]
MRKGTAWLFSAGVSLLATTAYAQTAKDTTADDHEIIVTAQNRKENVQNVPIAISVVSGAALVSKGVTDFTSIQKVSPALNITNDTNNTRVTVRGVGTLSNNEAQDQSIAVNIDGEYINRPTILNAAIFDLDRVEVLRGPQGTLYGRNSTGGAVNFITRKPGDHFAANGSVTYGNYNQVIVDGGLDVPLAGIGGIRFAGFYRSHDGYSYHPNTPSSPTAAYTPVNTQRSDDDNTGGGRISLRLRPLQGLTIDGAVEYVEQNLIPASQAGGDMTSAANNPGASGCGNGWASAGTVSGAPACVPQNTHALVAINRQSYNSPAQGSGWLHQYSTAERGRIAYDAGPFTVTYTGGYRYTRDSNVLTLAPNYVFTHFGETVKTQSHELRFNGITSGVTWQAGAFYFREKQWTNGGLYSAYIGQNGSYINYFQHPTDTQSISGFGQLEVPVTEQLTVVAGGRYTHDVRNATFRAFNPFYYAFAGGTGAYNTGPINLAPLASQIGYSDVPLHYAGSKATWLAGINYKPNTRTLVYAKVSTGYKAGGFDGSGNTFRPENNTAYEGGAKLKLGDRGQHTFNVAGFYYDYKDLQNDVLLNPVIGAQTFNAGRARIYGLEAEANLRPTSDDTLTLSANWTHGRYTQFTASVNYYNQDGTQNPTINLAGNHLPQSPDYVLTLGYDHAFHLGNGATVTASVFERYKSGYYLDFYNYHDSYQIGHTQTDLSIEYKPRNKAYSVQAYVRNLENYRSLTYAANTVISGQANIYSWQFGPPRTFGARLGFEF